MSENIDICNNIKFIYNLKEKTLSLYSITAMIEKFEWRTEQLFILENGD